MSGGVGADRKRGRRATAPGRYPIAEHLNLTFAGSGAVIANPGTSSGLFLTLIVQGLGEDVLANQT